MTKIISVDLDNILADSGNAFLQFYGNTIKDKILQITDISEYYLHNIPQLEMSSDENEALRDKFFIEVRKEHFLPVPGAVAWIAKLQSLGYEMYVVTWRKDKRHDVTKERVDHRFPDVFADIVFSNSLTASAIDKWTLCKRIGAEKHIDDYLIFAEEVTSSGIDVVLLDKPRNHTYDPQVHTWIKKVFSWEEIVGEFDV